MKKYYLFGAGNNCIGVIKFFGKDNIIAIIDSDSARFGDCVEAIPIIPLEEYLDKGDNRQIIITGYFRANEMAQILEENGIYNYYKSPYMQMGFYEDGTDIVNKLELDRYSEIILDDDNPMSDEIISALKNKEKSILIKYWDDSNDKCDDGTPVVVTCEDKVTKEQSRLLDRFKVYDLIAIYKKNYRYKNCDLIKFKDIHKGERCFIIGNGPSLSYGDLDTLYKYNEICFGVNRIYRAFTHTIWRPDYYVVVDAMVLQNSRQQIQSIHGTKFIRHLYKMDALMETESVYEFGGLNIKAGQPQFSLDIVDGVYMGNTVVYDAIQIAVYMGFEEIYLLGVDMTSTKRADEEGFHFYKIEDKNEKFFLGNQEEALAALKNAGTVIKEMGRTIRNATRGGELEELERVDFDSLFEKEAK